MSISRSVCAALVLVGIAACQPAARPLMESDVAKLKAETDTYVKTTLAADWDAFGAMMADNVIALPPNSPPLVGKKAWLDYVKAYPKVIQFTAPVDEVGGSGDVAWVRGKYILGAVLPTGQPISEQGSYLTTHKKAADGSWPYTQLIWHADTPAPVPAPAPRRGK